MLKVRQAVCYGYTLHSAAMEVVVGACLAW